MSSPSSFFATLWATPPGGLSRLSRYTIANGALYFAAGLFFYVVPEGLLETIWLVDVEGYDLGLSHSLGVTLMVIGWFYVMGARTGATSFGLATVADRMLIPAVLIPLWATGQMPAVPVFLFSILDPVLALGAYAIWRMEGPTTPR